MRQVVRQALDLFARLLLKALDLGDLCDQDVISAIERLSGDVRWPRKTPIRHRVERPPDDLAISGHQTLEVPRQLRRAQLKPHEKGSRRTDSRSVLHSLRPGTFRRKNAMIPCPLASACCMGGGVRLSKQSGDDRLT